VAPARIGLIGMGFVGRTLYERIGAEGGAEMEVAFVHDRNPELLAACEPEQALPDLARFAEREPDLVVEAATAEISIRHGAELLSACDYMPLSVSALADPDLERSLTERAAAAGTRLVIPHGALVGLDALAERSGIWREVSITFRKEPRFIDFSDAGGRPQLDGPTVLYDGPVRELARLYPRNVNAMVAAALASVGLDRCRGTLVAEPGLGMHVAEVRAVTEDGSTLESVKRQRAAGVSGTEVPDSLMHSIRAVVRPPGTQFA
jgi:aspartate dehydrogenase